MTSPHPLPSFVRSRDAQAPVQAALSNAQLNALLHEADVQRVQEAEAPVAELQSTAHDSITESEYLIDDPSTTVCSAYVRALVERYGRPAVVDALGR